jgi:hypothetical protein
VQTRWATALPHILRLESDSGEALVIQSPDRYQSGQINFPGSGDRSIQGRAMDGATVAGALSGTLDVSQADDSTRIDIAGVRTKRETVPFDASCLLFDV